MMKKCLAFLVLCASAVAVSAADKPLNVQVFTSSPEGFSVNATLVSGKKEAILIDAQFLASDADKLATAIQGTKKKLTTIYVTHYHPDHYFGLTALKRTFPQARIVAQAATVQLIQQSWKQKVDQWKPSYGENIPAQPVLPEAIDAAGLKLEGETLDVHAGQGDAKDNSYVWIPSIKTVIAGDIVYSGVYPWTVETTAADRKRWIGTLDQITALNPTMVVAGHKNPGVRDDAASLVFMKEYLAYYDTALPQSKSSDEFQAKIKEKYPTLTLDIILKIAADAAFPAKAKPKTH